MTERQMRTLNEHSAILNPERLTITGPDGELYRGADQDWFPDFWQQRAGCGPTAAALLVAYLAQKPGLEALYPGRAMDREHFTGLMCRVWEHVTPGSHGLNKPEKFAEGLASYGAAAGVPLSPVLMELPAAYTKRPSFAEYAAFLHACLDADCPVAFLNLHNGKEKRLDRWHWVTVIALDGEEAVILDSGRELSVNLALWRDTSKKRGGFVGFPRGVGA